MAYLPITAAMYRRMVPQEGAWCQTRGRFAGEAGCASGKMPNTCVWDSTPAEEMMKLAIPFCVLGLMSWATGALGQGTVGPYKPDWASLDARPIPQWFTDAKFGIFIHWGLYSVPAWGPKGSYAEWYWNAMQDHNGPTWKFHERVYGADFPYSAFAPMFKAELFDPQQWADIFARSGARYVVLTSKHHEGFCLWPSAEADRTWGRPWNSVSTGPHRDLLGDLAKAVRARGLHMGIYYSLYEWFNPLYRSDFPRYRDEHFFPQFKDVVTRYKPDVIFADGEWEHTSEEWRTPELLAWLYNESGCGPDLVVNDRWGKETRGKHGGYYTTEYGGATDFKAKPGHPWEENRGMGASYGYNRNEAIDDYRSAADLLHLLVDTVSAGGNLLLDVGPTADGRIPVVMQDRLIQMGRWLQKNGEAVYGAGPSPFFPRKFDWGACTSKPGKLYIHLYRRPGDVVEVPPVGGRVRGAWFLEDPQHKLRVRTHATGVQISLPQFLPDAAISTIVLDVEGPKGR